MNTIKSQIKLLTVAAFMAMAAISASATDGTWSNLVVTTTNSYASGSWVTNANWQGGSIATGTDGIADFSTLTFTNANSTVTLDAARTIGRMNFANGAPTNWVVNASYTNATLPAADAITLAVSAGTPVINVSNQLATFNASVFGANGFIKAGGGTLRLNGVATNAAGTLSGWWSRAGHGGSLFQCHQRVENHVLSIQRTLQQVAKS